MSGIDIFIIVIVIIGVLRGMQLGAIKQITSFAGLIIALILSRLLGDWMMGILMSVFPSLREMPAPDVITSLLGHIIIFAMVYMGIYMLGSMIRSITHALHLGIFDRFAGAIMCTFKYAIILSVVLNLWFVLSPSSSIFSSSRLANGSVLRFTITLAPAIFGSELVPMVKEAFKSDAT